MLPILPAKIDPDVLTPFVFQLVNQPLNFISFIKIKESGSTFQVYPSPEQLADRIFMGKMKIRSRKMKFTGKAHCFFLFPKAVSTGCANFRKE